MPSGRELGLVARHLDARLDPAALFELLDVHVLDADLAAVDGLERGNDLAQGRGAKAQEIVDEDRPVVIGIGEAIGGRIKVGMRLEAGEAERIEVGDEVAAHTIAADEVHRLDRIERRPAGIGAGRGGNTGRYRRPTAAIADDVRAPGAPAGSVKVAPHRFGRVGKLGEEAAPARIDRAGIVEVAGIELGDKAGINARKKGRIVQSRHEVLSKI